MSIQPLGNILGKKYALRNLLQDKQYHNRDDISIPKENIGFEKEPFLHTVCLHYAKEISKDPNLVLADTYSLEERKKDWESLVKKEVIQNGSILKIDSRSKPGHKILDHFMPHFWDVTNYKGISVRSCFTEEKLFKALLTNVQMHSTPYPSEIRKMIIMTSGLGSVTKYRTVTAKAIVQYFGAKQIFDPCVGWGGRMLGTLAAGKDIYYTGCEPDKNTSDGLMNILNDESIPKEITDRADIYNEPVEKVLPILKEKYDMILTSPPYFNLELYTNGQQSTSTYKDWETWITNWLKPTVLGCLALVKNGGTSCWSVKNFKSDKSYPLADEVKKIHETAGWQLVKTVKMTGSAHMGLERIQDGKETRMSEEETFCFQRKT
jgi:hypothetical protein